MPNGIPTSIPFLESAYRERAATPDTGGASFIRAYERAQERKTQERELAMREALLPLQVKVQQQNLLKSQLDLATALQNRDDELEAQTALSTLSERIRRAKIIGSDDPSAQRHIIDWVQQHRGILTLPAGKALWEDYLQSIEDDRKHKIQLDEIRVRSEETLTGIEMRAEDRLELERLRAELRAKSFEPRELTLPSGVKLIQTSPNQYRIAPVEGPSEILTLNQLLQLAGQLDKAGDQESIDTADQIRDFLSEKAESQIGLPPPPKPAPKPTDKTYLQPPARELREVNMIYMTPKGPARWTGTGWELQEERLRQQYLK